MVANLEADFMEYTGLAVSVFLAHVEKAMSKRRVGRESKKVLAFLISCGIIVSGSRFIFVRVGVPHSLFLGEPL